MNVFLKNYLSIDETLDYVQKEIDDNSNIKRSAKTVVKNAIDLLDLKPVFKFGGYAVLSKIIKDETSRNSTEYKQVFRLSGYFYDSSTFYPRDYKTFTHFSNLDEPFFHSAQAVVDKLVDSICVNTHYLKNIYDENGYHAHLDKDSKIKAFNFEPNEYLILSGERPVFSDFYQENREAVQIPRENVFFKISELDYIINSFSKSDYKPSASSSKENISLQIENKQLRKRINFLEQQISTTVKDEGQGDSLLILGAVMHCIKEAAKKNFTQDLLNQTILNRYKSVSGISKGTLDKKYSEAKKYLEQRLTP